MNRICVDEIIEVWNNNENSIDVNLVLWTWQIIKNIENMFKIVPDFRVATLNFKSPRQWLKFQETNPTFPPNQLIKNKDDRCCLHIFFIPCSGTESSKRVYVIAVGWVWRAHYGRSEHALNCLKSCFDCWIGVLTKIAAEFEMVIQLPKHLVIPRRWCLRFANLKIWEQQRRMDGI